MLTGTPPFPRSGDGVVLVAHIVDPVPPLEEHGVSVPPALEALLMKALAKETADRQQTMSELAAELSAADASPGKETMPGRAVVPGEAARPETAAPAPAKVPEAVSMRAPVSAPVLGGNTTFSRASGQVAAARTGASPPSRRPPWLVAGAVLVGVGAALLVMLGGARRSPAPRPAPAQQQPTPPLAQPPAPVPEEPRPAPAQAVAQVRPQVRPQVRFELDSDPPGATVWNGAEPAALGTTPLRRSLDRGPRVLQLRIEKRGFRTETVEVNLDADFARTITLRPRQRAVADPDESRKL
jgi:serine/threonine-protein kinase